MHEDIPEWVEEIRQQPSEGAVLILAEHMLNHGIEVEARLCQPELMTLFIDMVQAADMREDPEVGLPYRLAMAMKACQLAMADATRWAAAQPFWQEKIDKQQGR